MIELKHLATYLPYRINVQIERLKYPIGKEIVELSLKNIDQFDNKKMWKFKPILRPMSDLIPIEDDEVNDMVLIKLVNETDQHCDAYDEWRDSYFDNPEPMRLLQAPYEVFEELVKQNYDVFDLIGEGLAISIHDLEK